MANSGSRWQIAAVWLLGLAPAMILPGALNRFVFIKLTFGAAAVGCAMMARPTGRLQRQAVTALWAGFTVLLLSAALGQAPVAQLIGRAPRYEGIVSLTVYAGALLVGAWLLGASADPSTRTHLLRATAVAAGVVAVVAVLETLGVHPLATTTSRPGSLLGNATEQGAYGAGIVGMGLYAVQSRSRWALATVVAGAVLVATSASRGALLGLVVAVLVTAFLGSSRTRRTALVSLGVATSLSFAIPLSRNRLLLLSPLSRQTVTGRLMEWKETLSLAAKHPVLGVGPSGFVDAEPSVRSAAYVRLAGTDRLDSPHSVPLQVLVSGGVLLLSVAVVMGWLLVRATLRLRRDQDQTAWAVGAAAAMAGWATVLLTHFTAPGSTPLFLVLAGSLLSEARSKPPNVLAQRAVVIGASAAAAVLLLAAAAEIPLRNGLTALQQGDVTAALTNFRTAHLLRSWDADLDAQIAHALVAQALPPEDRSQVEQYLNRAAAALPKDPLVLLDRAISAAQRGALHEAVTRLDEAAMLAPNDAEAVYLRGQLRARTRDLAGAVLDLRASANLLPTSPQPLQALAGVYQMLGQTDLANAALSEAQARTR